MAMNRIYLVTNTETNSRALVEAGNVAQAIRHVVGGKYHAKPASAKEAHELAAAGVQLEVAAKEAPEPAPAPAPAA